MTGKIATMVLILFAATLFFLPNAGATIISLAPAVSIVDIGDTFNIDVMADIDAPDAIIGFGFDLDMVGSGALAFNGFSPNAPLFAIDPFHQAVSDSDGILAASAGDIMFGPGVSGADILLGSLSFTATGAGDVSVGLGADDLSTWFTEGFIPENTMVPNFMPAVSAAQVSVNSSSVPEPATFILLGLGLCCMTGLRTRTKR